MKMENIVLIIAGADSQRNLEIDRLKLLFSQLSDNAYPAF